MLQENRSYSLWVTAYDGSIPQRTEVYASITDKSGQRRNPPHPALPFPFQPKLPKPPISFPDFDLPAQTTVTVTKVTEDYTEEVTVPEPATTLSPPKPPDDIPKVDEQNKDKNTSAVKNEESSNDGPLTVIPLVAISGLVVIVAGVIFFIWKRNQTPKTSSKKEDMVSNKIMLTL